MHARLTRDGLLRLELRLGPRQRLALYERCEELRREHGALSDAECLAMLVEDFFVGPGGLVPPDDEALAVA
jgi:hypothetical protein